jgi:hypothetical protein
MKSSIVIAVLCALGASASADKPPTRAEAMARVWFTAAVAKDTSVVASKDAPVHYWLDGDAATCRKLGHGKATSTGELDQLRTCLREQTQQVQLDPFHEIKLDKAIGGYPKAVQKDMRAVARGATLARASHEQDGETLTVTLALTPKLDVVAIWLVTEGG